MWKWDCHAGETARKSMHAESSEQGRVADEIRGGGDQKRDRC